MIEPIRSGRGLLEEIKETDPAPGQIAVWWLGQSGFLIKSSETTLLIDPYLSEHLTTKYQQSDRPHIRMTRAPIRGADLSEIDHVLASHRHSDHLDPGSILDLLKAPSQAKLVLPRSLRQHAESLGVHKDRQIGLVAGETFRASGVSVHAVPSAHEGLDTDETGCHLYLGFVIEIAGLRLYHSGDTLAYDGLIEAIGSEPVDVMFLPINGRDPSRGVAGNMTSAEAVALANGVGPRFIVPHHYDMFTFNTVPVEAFEEEARRLSPKIRSQVLKCGARWEIQR